jgi:LPS-assembly protein
VTPRFAPLVATLLLAFARLDAAEFVLPQITAQSNRTTPEASVFTGEVRLAHKDVVLYADEVTYRNGDRVAVARGNVTLIKGVQRLVAEEVTYRLDDRTYSVGRFRVGQAGYVAEGSSAEGTPENLVVSNASIYFEDPDAFTPFLRTEKLSYTEATEKKTSVAKVEGASLGIGNKTLLRLPGFSETPRDPTIAGLQAKVGFSGNVGAEISLAVKTSVNEDVRIGGDLGLFAKRGVLVGPIGDYDTYSLDGIGARGDFRTGFIKDQGDTGLDIRSDVIRDERGYAEWRHQQTFAPGLTLAGQLHYWSDSYVTRDFRSEGYYGIQTPDSWLEAQKLGDNYVVSLFTRVEVNDYFLAQERLPEVRFDGLPVEIGGGIYHRINASVAALKEDDPITDITTRSDRADLYYGAYRPFSPREWFSFTPTAGARVTHYERTAATSNKGNYTRVLGEVGFDSKLWESSGTWNYKNLRWDIDGLRHVVTPRLSYRYSPSSDVGRADIPRIDDDPFNTYLRPLGLADRRDIDRLPALNTFRFGVDNVLQTRSKTYGSRNLAELNLAVDQHVDSEAATSQSQPQTRSRSDVHSFFALTPAPWLRYDLYSRTTAQTGEVEEVNTGLTVNDSDVWRFRLGTHYLNDPVTARRIEEYTATYGLRLNEIYSIVARVRYNANTATFTEQSIELSQRLSRLWTLHYALSSFDGPRREDDLGVSVSIEAEGF